MKRAQFQNAINHDRSSIQHMYSHMYCGYIIRYWARSDEGQKAKTALSQGPDVSR